MHRLIEQFKKSVYHIKWIYRMLFFVTIIFVGNYIVSNFDGEVFKKISIDPLWLSIAVVVNFIYVLIYAFLWHAITRANNSALPMPAAVAIWLFSNFGKYFSLKIAGVGYRFALYQQRTGKRYAEIGQLCYIEYLASLLGGFVVIFVLMVFLDMQSIIQHTFWLYVGGSIALCFLLLPSVQNKLLNISLNIMKREPVPVTANKVWPFRWVFAYAATWMVLGASLFCLIKSIYPPIELRNWFRITSSYVTAGVVGMISVFAPSGIGVREGVLMLGMTSLTPAPIAAVVTILARIIATIAELIGIIIGFLYLEGEKTKNL